MMVHWELACCTSISRHIRPQRRRFTLLTLFLFCSIGLRILNPQIIRGFIDSALAGDALSKLTAASEEMRPLWQLETA